MKQALTNDQLEKLWPFSQNGSRQRRPLAGRGMYAVVLRRRKGQPVRVVD